MDFGAALADLKLGMCVSRSGWNGPGMWIKLRTPGIEVKPQMTLPFIFMKTVQGEFVPWLASQTDLLAEDWVVVEPS